MLFRRAKKRRKERSLRGRSSATKRRVAPSRTRRKVKSTTNRKKTVRKARKHTVKRVRRRHKHDLAGTALQQNPLISPAPVQRLLRLFVRLCLLLLLIFSVYLLAAHPALQISQISISGNKTIPSQDIKQTASSILEGKRLAFLPSKHYAFVPLRELQSIISDKFPVDAVHVQKVFPGSLVITIEEQVSSIIYDNTNQYFLVDRGGKIIEPIRNVASYEWTQESTIEITTSTNFYDDLLPTKKEHAPDVASFSSEFEGLPLVVDNRSTALQEDVNDGTISINLVSSTLHWQRMFEKNTLSFFYMNVTDPRAMQATIYGKEGRVYMVSLSHDSTPQLAKIQTVLEDHPNANRIDVRFPGRVYWE